MRTRQCGRILVAALFACSLVTSIAIPASASPSAPAARTPKGGNFTAVALGPLVSVYDKPVSAEPARVFSNPTPTSGELVFLVQRLRSDGWAKVFLPVRPNGSQGWVSVDEVAIKFVQYRVVVDLSDHELMLYKNKKVVERESVGIGKSSTPTPGGRYYITQLFELPNPDGEYGPFAYALSGFSETLDAFNGGDAVVGIHGTNHPELVGQDVSSGCIRMRNDAIKRLRARLPLGTPVSIQE